GVASGGLDSALVAGKLLQVHAGTLWFRRPSAIWDRGDSCDGAAAARATVRTHRTTYAGIGWTQKATQSRAPADSGKRPAGNSRPPRQLFPVLISAWSTKLVSLIPRDQEFGKSRRGTHECVRHACVEGRPTSAADFYHDRWGEG